MRSITASSVFSTRGHQREHAEAKPGCATGGGRTNPLGPAANIPSRASEEASHEGLEIHGRKADFAPPWNETTPEGVWILRQ